MVRLNVSKLKLAEHESGIDNLKVSGQNIKIWETSFKRQEEPFMTFGFAGTILRVDLSKAEISKDKLREEMLRKFLGGAGLAIKILYDEMPPECDAFAPLNPLIFMTGPLTGTSAPGSCLYNVVSKSPLTGVTMGRARANGFFSPELKSAGFDGIVIKGKAEKPSYLWIHNGEIEIRDATHLWRKDTAETEDSIKTELGDERIKVACIGPAGELLARMACIVNDKHHVAARGGLGAVMGSKHLKAIAVRGTKKVSIHSIEKFLEICRKWRKMAAESVTGKALMAWGTAGDMESAEVRNYAGGWPIKNYTTCVLGDWTQLSGEYIVKTFQTTKKPAECWGCPLLHDRLVRVKKDEHFKNYAFPEYEDVAAFGSNLGISKASSIIELTDLANRYGIDSVEASFTISLAMECYEKGLITKNETDNLDLTWGNAEAVAQLLGKIARREGIGNVLADGVKRAADKIGKGAGEFAVHIKNMAPMQHDLRSDWGLMLGYTVSGAGPVHEGVGKFLLPDPDLGFPENLPPFRTNRKAEAVKKEQLKRLLSDNLGVCNFPARCISQNLVVEALSAATGWDVSIEEAYNACERSVHLARAFNVRQGLTPSDDWPSSRILEPPLDGVVKGIDVKPYLKKMVKEYYQIMGWDARTGKPSVRILKKLGLEDEAKALWADPRS